MSHSWVHSTCLRSDNQVKTHPSETQDVSLPYFLEIRNTHKHSVSFLLAEDIIWVHVQSQNFSNVSHTHVEYAHCWLALSGHQWSILLPTMLHNGIFMCVVMWRRWKHCCHEKHGSRTCRTEMITAALKSQDSTLQGSFTNTITARSPDQRMPAGWWLSAASSLYWLLHSDWSPRTGQWPDLQPL